MKHPTFLFHKNSTLVCQIFDWLGNQFGEVSQNTILIVFKVNSDDLCISTYHLEFKMDFIRKLGMFSGSVPLHCRIFP